MYKNLILLGLLGLTIYLCFLNFRYRYKLAIFTHNSSQLFKSDTIFLPVKEYQEAKPFKDVQDPSTVIIYSIPRDSDEVARHYPDRNSFSLQDSITTTPGPNLFDSISQILIKNNLLELTTKNTLDSTYKIRKFDIDLSKYNYNWVNNSLTYKKKLHLKLIPYVQGSYRPFNKFTDLEAGINLETSRFNYNLGINFFYYPSLQKSVGKDLKLSITYKFN